MNKGIKELMPNYWVYNFHIQYVITFLHKHIRDLELTDLRNISGQ